MSYYQGDYYMAGGFFKKAFRGARRFVKKGVRLAGRAAPLVTLVNPALGLGLTTVSQVVGRTSQLLSPAAAPAGMPAEGTPPAAPAYQAATYGGMDPMFMQLLLMLLLRRR